MEPFALSQKLEDLNVVLYQAVQKYPKSEKFTLAKETTMCGIRAALFVARGNKVRGYMAFIGHYKHCNANRSIESALNRIIFSGKGKGERYDRN